MCLGLTSPVALQALPSKGPGACQEDMYALPSSGPRACQDDMYVDFCILKLAESHAGHFCILKLAESHAGSIPCVTWDAPVRSHWQEVRRQATR